MPPGSSTATSKPSNVLIAGDHGAEQPLHAWLGILGQPADGRARGGVRPSARWARSISAAPEQIRGDSIDHRADIYSLGCLLFECLTGSVPFTHTSVAGVLYAHMESAPPRVSELDLGLPTRWMR